MLCSIVVFLGDCGVCTVIIADLKRTRYCYLIILSSEPIFFASISYAIFVALLRRTRYNTNYFEGDRD